MPGGGGFPLAAKLRLRLLRGVVAMQRKSDRRIVALIVAMLLLGMVFALSVIFAFR